MSELIELLNVAVSTKPVIGSQCNNCGYCCLTEVCVVGQELTGNTIGPCTLLVKEKGSDKHHCQLVLNDDSETMANILGIGTGCCAETQNEAMARLM